MQIIDTIKQIQLNKEKKIDHNFISDINSAIRIPKKYFLTKKYAGTIPVIHIIKYITIYI